MRSHCSVLVGLLAGLGVAEASPAATLDTQSVEKTVRTELKKLQVPSASVAIVLDAQVAYADAFGIAQEDTGRRTTKSARYEIGSISKQFLATALLMLQEQGKLRLDDKAGKFIPDLGPATDVTLRQLLSHTAGLRDYYPQDYVFTRMMSPIERDDLLNMWARQPLDFQPGTRWQYSNTGYTVAGVIFEKVSGGAVFGFLQQQVFTPLSMHSVVNVDEGNLGASDAVGYTRAALGPEHPAVREGRGWLFAAGELAMTAEDLARWDISIIDQTLMKPASYRELETETMLADGIGSGYALGLSVRMTSERRVLRHGGGTSGFISMNVIYPDQRAAIVVLTNSDSADAASAIAGKLADVVFEYASPIDRSRRDQARRIFAGLRQGKLDHSLFTENANAYFTPSTVEEIAHGLVPLGSVKSFKLVSVGTRGGLDVRTYEISLVKRDLSLVTRAQPDGKLEQYMIFAK